MARPLRIEYPGAWYHVMNRGGSRQRIFLGDEDYLAFLWLLGKCSELFDLEVHAYSLMPNHYHLLVRTPNANLSRAMRHLNGVYTQKFNYRHDRDGVLFRGRYKSILVGDDVYLRKLVQYIHRNPLEAGMEDEPGRHRWTSHNAYMEAGPSPGWLHKDYILGCFRDEPVTGRKEAASQSPELARLDAFVRMQSDKDFLSLFRYGHSPAVIGSEEFKVWLRKEFLASQVDEKNKPDLRRFLREWSVDDLNRAACKRWGIKTDNLSKVRRGRENPERRALLYACRRFLKAETAEISSAFGGIGHSAVSLNFKRAESEIDQKTGCYKFVCDLEEILNCQVKT